MKSDGSFNVKDFGAQGDGQTLETESIQKAIDDCADSGGGMIVFPSGVYRTGAIRLRSHVGLHLDSGATIKDIAFEDVQVKIAKDPRAAQRGGIFDLRPAFDEAHSWVEHDTPSMYCQHVDGLRIRNTKIELDDDLPGFITAGLQCESVKGLDSDSFIDSAIKY